VAEIKCKDCGTCRFLMLFEGEDSEIDLAQPEPEFSEFKWVDVHEMPRHVRRSTAHCSVPQTSESVGHPAVCDMLREPAVATAPIDVPGEMCRWCPSKGKCTKLWCGNSHPSSRSASKMAHWSSDSGSDSIA